MAAMTKPLRKFNLSPNPFQNQTKIAWTIDQPGLVRLNIYDRSGRLVRTLIDKLLMKPETYTMNWDGKDNDNQALVPGVYFIRLETAQETRTLKTIHLR